MKTFKYFIILILLLFTVSPAAADVLFNEIMASNAVYINGRSDDWIELKNTSSYGVSLRGWYLSDDPYNLTRWAFPDTAYIDGGGYLLIYCTDDEKIEGGARNALYADFQLKAEGETLYLTNNKGQTATLTFGAQYGNVSYGVPQDGEGWHYLETATPGKANQSLYFDQRAAEPVIETTPGFYKDGITVSLAAADGLNIYYTTDCSTPTRESLLYTGPFTITQTTIVRACAAADDQLLSTIASASYIIENEPQPSVPVISLYTDNAYLYSEDMGIMVEGDGDIPNYEQNWEYPFHIEYFDENGVLQLSQMGTGRISGNTTRRFRQKTLSLYARSALGGHTFDYAFFEDRPYSQYASIQLRSANSDARICRLRDAVLSEMSKGLNLYYSAGKPVVVYINGEYYGHYNLREKANKDSLAQWEGITDEDVIENVDILEFTGMKSIYVIRGSNEDWIELMNFCRKKDLNDPENLQYVLDRMDVDSLFNYCIFNMMIGNYDTGNVRMYRFEGGKWKYMLHDVELGCSNNNGVPVNVFLMDKWEDAATFAHWPLAALLEVPYYKDYFLKRAAEITQSHFLYSQSVAPVFEKWTEAIRPLMGRHIEKFGHFQSVSDWESNVQNAMYYARIRPEKVLNLICKHLKVSDVDKEAYFGETFELLKTYNAE